MFDIGMQEMLLVGVVALIILGPQRFPIAIRAVVLWVTRLRSGVDSVKNELQQEFGLDELRQQINSQELMQPIQQIKDELSRPVLPSRRSMSDSDTV